MQLQQLSAGAAGYGEEPLSTALLEAQHKLNINIMMCPLQDFDPPSEGQVKGRDLLRALLTKMEQGVTQRGARPQPEVSLQASECT